MRVLSLLAVCMALSGAATVSVDERPPYPYVRTSRTGEYYFKMVPDGESGGSGTAYQVTAATTDPVLWSVAGWYSFGTQISADGHYLVRLGKSSETEPLVAFYENGKLIAQHMVADLIDDPSPRMRTSHFSYLSSARFISGSAFEVVTDEQVEFTFDYHSGKLISKRSP